MTEYESTGTNDSSCPSADCAVKMTVNGNVHVDASVSSRLTLADYLRERLRLTGTKLGCEHGVCGACTILVNQLPTRACLMLAVQADDRDIRTVESLDHRGKLNALQESFQKHHALQCGFCTSGFLMSATALLDHTPRPTRRQVIDALSGNLCRCTGYETIIDAVLDASGATDRTTQPVLPDDGSTRPLNSHHSDEGSIR